MSTPLMKSLGLAGRCGTKTIRGEAAGRPFPRTSQLRFASSPHRCSRELRVRTASFDDVEELGGLAAREITRVSAARQNNDIDAVKTAADQARRHATIMAEVAKDV